MSRTTIESPFNYEILQDQLLINIETILDQLGVDYRITANRLMFQCPVHEGTKYTSSFIYLNSGVWNCRSRNCHAEHGANIYGLIKGVFRVQNKTEGELVNFISQFTDSMVDYKPICIPKQEIQYFDESTKLRTSIPSPYYLRRKQGISAEALRHFEIGDCSKGFLAHRAVVPIYHYNGGYMGYTARSMFDQCPKCKNYHTVYRTCPPDNEPSPKWRHKAGCKTSLSLYGLDKRRHDKLVLVEGPSCVWKLWDLNISAAACLGGTFTINQMELLKHLDIKTVILAFDKDETGNILKQQFLELCDQSFLPNVHAVNLTAKDITDMTHEDIMNTVGKKWNQV